MNLVHSASTFSTVRFLRPRYPSSTPPRRRFFTGRLNLPFVNQGAKYYKEIEAAINAVEKACRLCLHDSAFLRANNLVDSVVSVVTDKTSFSDESLTHSDVLEAIDGDGKAAFAFGVEPATYWVLDPIDGTKAFVRGPEALYVDDNNVPSRSGIIMVAHKGHGTWKRRLSHVGSSTEILGSLTRCFVDRFCSVKEARFCIQDSQSWDLIPLSALFDATTDADSIGDKEILLVPTCCGSLCKNLMIASGRGSVYILRALTHKIIKAWDHVAGQICVQEAGGKVTDWRGRKSS